MYLSCPSVFPVLSLVVGVGGPWQRAIGYLGVRAAALISRLHVILVRFVSMVLFSAFRNFFRV